MQLNTLPTPQQVLKGIWDMFKSLVFLLILWMVMVPTMQLVVCLIGLALVYFHHWIIGITLCSLAAICRIARRHM